MFIIQYVLMCRSVRGEGGGVVIIMHRGHRSSCDGGEHRGYKNPRSFLTKIDRINQIIKCVWWR